MKHIKYLSLLVLSLLSNANESIPLDDILTLRWENRLIIVNQHTDSDNALSLMKKYSKDINERDIVWFIMKEAGAVTNYSGRLSDSFMSNVQQQYRLKKNTVTLIGKDGDIKSQEKSIDVQTLFSTIDAMQMRQREVQLNQ
ncbi:DUF4174 domain-containing protein [uncultured Pseudoalteromonas sp.]|uniref:DUF4174 domain-containing protein n=1 Tax=uncultured Pseudoalteromonas sp. TaxID=114053 RepID=UPI0030C81761